LETDLLIEMRPAKVRAKKKKLSIFPIPDDALTSKGAFLEIEITLNL